MGAGQNASDVEVNFATCQRVGGRQDTISYGGNQIFQPLPERLLIPARVSHASAACRRSFGRTFLAPESTAAVGGRNDGAVASWMTSLLGK